LKFIRLLSFDLIMSKFKFKFDSHFVDWLAVALTLN
jgi:hypothetical protein